MQALADGQLSYVHEYNPLFGETALEVVEKALAGDKVESYIVVPSEDVRLRRGSQGRPGRPQVLITPPERSG